MMAERLPITGRVIRVTRASAALTRPVSVEDARVASAAIDLLAAIVGVARVDPLGEIVQRTLTPTANRLAAALRDAGHQFGPEEGQA